MPDTRDLIRDPSPRSSRPAVRWLGTRPTIVCALGLGLLFGSCKDAEIVEPSSDPDSTATLADSTVAQVEMLPAERSLSFIGHTYGLGARTWAADSIFLWASHRRPELFTWSSSAPDVVAVDSLGVVTALRVGTAKVTATSGGVTGTATVTVRDAVRLAWSRPLRSSIRDWVTIADDGTIYLGLSEGGQTGPVSNVRVEALAPDGTPLWSLPTGRLPYSVPAIGPDGTLYVATDHPDTSLIAVGRAGDTLWTASDLGEVVSSPAIGSDGTIYVASTNSTLYAIDAAGRKKWGFKAGGRFFLGSPAIAQDGTVVVGAEDGYLYAVEPDGTKAWAFQVPKVPEAETPPRNWGSPVIGLDGKIYFTPGESCAAGRGECFGDRYLYALNPNGTLAWRLRLPVQDGGSPAIGSDGTIYVGGDGLHAVDPSGRLRWTYPGPNPRSGTVLFWPPIVAGDGSIYAMVPGGRYGGVYALAADGTLKWDYPIDGFWSGVPLIGRDGTIFILSTEGAGLGAGARTLHAIVERDGSNGGYANAPWPKVRGNRANTGRAGGGSLSAQVESASTTSKLAWPEAVVPPTRRPE